MSDQREDFDYMSSPSVRKAKKKKTPAQSKPKVEKPKKPDATKQEKLINDEVTEEEDSQNHLQSFFCGFEKGGKTFWITNKYARALISATMILAYIPPLAFYIVQQGSLEALLQQNQAISDAKTSNEQDNMGDLSSKTDSAVQSSTDNMITSEIVGQGKTCIAQVALGIFTHLILSLMMLVMERKSFAVTQIVPLVSILANICILPLHAASTTTGEIHILGESLCIFMGLMVLSLVFYQTKTAQMVFCITISVIYIEMSLFSMDKGNIQDAESQKSLKLPRLLVHFVTHLSIIATMCILWLTSSTGQPLRRHTKLIQAQQKEVKQNMADMVSLLELDTKPYVVMKQTTPAAPPPSADQNVLPFDSSFFVKFMSRSFKSQILNNQLLSNQGAIKLNIQDPSKTKLFGKEKLDIEDLIFRKITKDYLKTLDDNCEDRQGNLVSSSGSDNDNATDDGQIREEGENMQKDEKLLITLKQLVDEWPAEEKLKPEDWTSGYACQFSRATYVFEIVTKESIWRECVFTGYSDFEKEEATGMQKYLKEQQQDPHQNDKSHHDLTSKSMSQGGGAINDSHQQRSQLHDAGKRLLIESQHEQLIEAIGSDNQFKSSSKQSKQIKKDLTLSHIEEKKSKHEGRKVTDKVFVHVTMHEVEMHGQLYRILRFHKIDQGYELKDLIRLTPLMQSDKSHQGGLAARMILQQGYDHDFFNPSNRFSNSYMNTSKQMDFGTSELSKYHSWLENHQNHSNSQTLFLRNVLENIRFLQADLLKNSDMHQSHHVSGSLQRQMSHFDWMHIERGKRQSGALMMNNSFKLQANVSQKNSGPVSPRSKSKSGDVMNVSASSKKEAQSRKEMRQNSMQIQMLLSDALCLVNGLNIESMTRQLCFRIMCKNRAAFFENLKLSQQNPLSVAAQTVRQLKQNLVRLRMKVRISPDPESVFTKMEFDWEVYACVLWNQILGIINDEKELFRLLLIDMSLVDTGADQELCIPEQLSATSSVEGAESSESAGEAVSNFEKSKSTQKSCKKYNEKVFLRTSIYFKKAVDADESEIIQNSRGVFKNKDKRTKSFLKAADYLCRSINGSIKKLDFEGVESYTMIIPTVIADTDKIEVKQNLISCLNFVFNDLKQKDYEKYFKKAQKQVIKLANFRFKSQPRLPESFMEYTNQKGVKKVENFSNIAQLSGVRSDFSKNSLAQSWISCEDAKSHFDPIKQNSQQAEEIKNHEINKKANYVQSRRSRSNEAEINEKERDVNDKEVKGSKINSVDRQEKDRKRGSHQNLFNSDQQIKDKKLLKLDQPAGLNNMNSFFEVPKDDSPSAIQYEKKLKEISERSIESSEHPKAKNKLKARGKNDKKGAGDQQSHRSNQMQNMKNQQKSPVRVNQNSERKSARPLDLDKVDKEERKGGTPMTPNKRQLNDQQRQQWQSSESCSSSDSSLNEDMDLKNKKPGAKESSKAVQEKSVRGCNCVATVLVCEDNFYNVVPLKMILRRDYNIQIERAENGKLGAEAYERNATKTCCQMYYKLIFMDINMPVLDGYGSSELIIKTFENLSQQSQYAHLQRPVIFAMTAYQNEQTVSKCLAAGLNGILYKPVNKKGLDAQIKKFFPQAV